MKWKASPDDYKKTFAILPVKIGDEYVWLESYYRRFDGDCYSVLTVADYIARNALKESGL